jgi:glycosyltransferase involved in cell wall biosynthesis
LWEGFPGVLVEFLASRTPIVATNSGGQTEIVQDGKTALLVPPSDPEALSAAIIRVVEDNELRNQLKENAPIRARDFSLDQMTRNFDALYRSYLDR